jgi:hypothetical protein
LGSAALAAEDPASVEPVPIEREPRHQLVFENAHVRFFDVQLEPGYQALYHTHIHDGVFVNIGSAETIAQSWGGEPVRRGERAIGETYFIGYTDKPGTHRVSNPDNRTYRVTDTEILKGCDTRGALRPDRNQTVVVDNAKVLVTRLILHPGESSELSGACGMLVAVSGGEVAFDADSEPESMQPAGFLWRDSGAQITLTNVGMTVFHGVDIRLK